MSSTLKILLVDDHEVVRRGVATLLADQPGWTVVAEAADGRVAIRLAKRHQPDVVVMDIGMAELNGFEATRQIRRKVPTAEVLILSMHDSDELVREVISAGARGYVLKSDAGRQLIAAVEAVAKHEPFFTSKLAAKAYADSLKPKRRRGRPALTSLTAREREVLQLMCEGHVSREVGERLAISSRTVETHRKRLMKKVGVSTLLGLIRYALRTRIVEP
ncbi:MAG TPA: response regulator transcription factor [Chthoniobacteraceae bacterium]|jgi:DNA-binding NarL/FixJ family response regulator